MNQPPRPPELDPSVIRNLEGVQGAQALVELFLARAAQVGVIAERVKPSDLATRIVELASHDNARRCLIDEALPQAQALADALSGSLTRLLPDAETLFQVDVAITGVQGAIAETGTLVWTSGPRRWRAMTLTPPLHIALVRPEQIVPDLWQALAQWDEQALPANINLITGPSKTADIEGVLVRGVHGPKTVAALVVEMAVENEALGE